MLFHIVGQIDGTEDESDTKYESSTLQVFSQNSLAPQATEHEGSCRDLTDLPLMI